MNFSDSTEQLSYKIRIIFPPILLAFGIPGNILSIIILYRLRKTQRSTYLVCLAVADLIFLGLWKLFDWVASVARLYLLDTYGTVCRIQIYGYFSCLQIASWMQVLVTVERVVSVASPHKVRTLFSSSRALVSVFLTIVVIFSLNTSFIIAPASDANFTSKRYCFDNDNFKYEPSSIWPWIYLSVGYFIPWTFLLFGNIVIVTILWRKTSTKNKTLSRDYAIGVRKYKVSTVTKRVIALNIVYNVCVSPVCLMSLLSLFGVSASELIYTILSMFMLVNNAVSFFLYIMLGSRFKQELVKILTSCKFQWCKTEQEQTPGTSAENTRF